MKSKKNIITVAIDSPAAAGAATQAKLIAKHYNLLYLDTGKIYRFIGKIYIKNKNKINILQIKKKINNLKIKDLRHKSLLSDKVGTAASIIAKKKIIRRLVYKFQVKSANFPPQKYKGSCLDGRDITYKIMPDATLKFFVTANIKIRAKRRYLELKKLKHGL